MGRFRPMRKGQPFASPEQTALDLDQIRELGANVVRVYHVPPRWFLDLAEAREMKVLVDIPVEQASELRYPGAPRRSARGGAQRGVGVRDGIRRCSRSASRMKFRRTSSAGTARGRRRILLMNWFSKRKRVDPDCLCTYSNFPPTEFLHPRAVDFVTFNVYLHQEPAFKSYLARLQMMADAKPLLLGEFGIDSAARRRGAQMRNVVVADRECVSRRAGGRHRFHLHGRMAQGREAGRGLGNGARVE